MDQTGIPVDLILEKLAVQAQRLEDIPRKAHDVLSGPLHTDLAATPYETVYAEDRVRLKHYRPVTEPRVKTPLLVVYALVNRETMLDLQPGRSVVQNFLDRGVDLYMVDWGYPTRKDQFLTIDDHVSGYMNNIVDFIRAGHGVDKINLMGICMGGTFSVIYAALHPEKVKNLVLTVTPTRFCHDKGLLNIWARHIDPDRMVEAYGNIPGDMMNFGFLLLNPARLMIDKYVGFLEHMDDKTFVENFIRMERWIFDSPDLPGETFRQFVRDCYQKDLLIRNELRVGNRIVNLRNITMPVLNIYGEYDHLVPPASSELLPDKVGTRDATNVCFSTGHIGIYVSGKCQRELVPRITDWLKQRDNGSDPETTNRIP